MKRYACILFTSVLVLIGCSAVSAQQQQQSPVNTTLAESASLADTLSWLDVKLRQYGRFTLHYPLYQPGLHFRTRFLGLEANGCVVTYRVSYEQRGSGSNDVISPARDAVKPVGYSSNVRERIVNLAALDPTLVRGESPKKWDGGVIIFGAGLGKVAVRSRDERGKMQEYEGGEFYVSEKEQVEAIAQALRRTVMLCRK
ncbi:MAG TPA: hypothetical protein VF735_05085 [Pyrinomonadaceae bacterium]